MFFLARRRRTPPAGILPQQLLVWGSRVAQGTNLGQGGNNPLLQLRGGTDVGLVCWVQARTLTPSRVLPPELGAFLAEIASSTKLEFSSQTILICNGISQGAG